MQLTITIYRINYFRAVPKQHELELLEYPGLDKTRAQITIHMPFIDISRRT